MILPTMTMSTTTTATTTIVMLMIMIASARTSLPCFAFLFPYDVGPIEWRKFHWTETKRTKLNRKEIYIEHIFSIPFYFTHTHTFARKQFSIRTCLPKSIYIHKLYSNVVRLLVISFMESSWNLRCFYYYSKESFQV